MPASRPPQAGRANVSTGVERYIPGTQPCDTAGNYTAGRNRYRQRVDRRLVTTAGSSGVPVSGPAGAGRTQVYPVPARRSPGAAGRRRDHRMITIVATGRAKADRVAEFRRLALALVGASRGEAGNVSYDFYEDLDDPAAFAFIEVWRDQIRDRRPQRDPPLHGVRRGRGAALRRAARDRAVPEGLLRRRLRGDGPGLGAGRRGARTLGAADVAPAGPAHRSPSNRGGEHGWRGRQAYAMPRAHGVDDVPDLGRDGPRLLDGPGAQDDDRAAREDGGRAPGFGPVDEPRELLGVVLDPLEVEREGEPEEGDPLAEVAGRDQVDDRASGTGSRNSAPAARRRATTAASAAWRWSASTSPVKTIFPER